MNSNQSKMSCKRGFTLIELLVVVLIIGILAAVAVPQYQKTIERSKATEAMSMLSSIAKAYQTYYLANGTYATKFEQLDVDIPFTGSTKFYDWNNIRDTKSNKDWSFQLLVDSPTVTLFAGRIDGKYKGAGFYVAFQKSTGKGEKIVKCFERTALPQGAYCLQIMHGKINGGDTSSRYYYLP